MSDPRELFQELLAAYRAGDRERFGSLCLENEDQIFHHFRTWAVVPYQIQGNPVATQAYARGIVGIAQFFALRGKDDLLEQLDGGGPNDPLDRWDQTFREFEEVMKAFDFAEARDLLQGMAADMRKYSGPAVDFRMPYVHERLTWLFFLTGDHESAELHGRAALDGYERMGHQDGQLTVTRRLADIHKAAGDLQASRHWIIRFTNLLIQTGRTANAVPVRKLHGIQPEDKIIDPGSPGED